MASEEHRRIHEPNKKCSNGDISQSYRTSRSNLAGKTSTPATLPPISGVKPSTPISEHNQNAVTLKCNLEKRRKAFLNSERDKLDRANERIEHRFEEIRSHFETQSERVKQTGSLSAHQNAALPYQGSSLRRPNSIDSGWTFCSLNASNSSSGISSALSSASQTTFSPQFIGGPNNLPHGRVQLAPILRHDDAASLGIRQTSLQSRHVMFDSVMSSNPFLNKNGSTACTSKTVSSPSLVGEKELHKFEPSKTEEIPRFDSNALQNNSDDCYETRIASVNVLKKENANNEYLNYELETPNQHTSSVNKDNGESRSESDEERDFQNAVLEWRLSRKSSPSSKSASKYHPAKKLNDSTLATRCSSASQSRPVQNPDNNVVFTSEMSLASKWMLRKLRKDCATEDWDKTDNTISKQTRNASESNILQLESEAEPVEII